MFSNNSFSMEISRLQSHKLCKLLTCSLGRQYKHQAAITTRRDLSFLYFYQATDYFTIPQQFPSLTKILPSSQLPFIFTVHVLLEPGFKLSQLVLCPFHHVHGCSQISTAHAVVNQCPDRMAFHLTILKIK